MGMEEGWKFEDSWEHGAFYVVGKIWESARLSRPRTEPLLWREPFLPWWPTGVWLPARNWDVMSDG
jgi:hypothetical protein